VNIKRFTFLVFQVCEHEKKLHTQQQLLVKVNKQLDEKLKTLQGIPIVFQIMSMNKNLSLLPSLCQTSVKISLVWPVLLNTKYYLFDRISAVQVAYKGYVVPIRCPLASLCCGFNSQQGLWILSCEEAIQAAYGTSVVLLWCPFAAKIMHGRAHEVVLYQ
jgi:hypothetical protein